MNSLLEPVELNRETTQTLDEIRSGADNPLLGSGAADAEEKIYHSVLPLIEGAGLPNHYVIHYRWFLREVAKLWRTRTGRDLAFHLELAIRKWIGLGLESRTLQFLVSESHQRLKAGGASTASPAPSIAATAPAVGTKPADADAKPTAPENVTDSGDNASAQDSDWLDGLA
ncbi:MAG TPA: hypothetical protein VMH22_12490 [bacterium]|nr:hypothetical protein [bacterium]